MIKRVSAILLVTTFVVVFATACSGVGPEERQPGDSAKAMFITQTMTNDAQAFTWREFQRLMGEFNITMTHISGNNEVAVEIDGVEMAIRDGYNVIFCNPSDTDAIVEPLRRAREAGIIVGIIATQLPEGAEDAMDFFVGTDDFAGSMTAGELVSEAFQSGANFVEVGGPAGTPAQIKRSDGFRVGLAENIIELDAKNSSGGWETAEAKAIMEEFLAVHGNAIDIVWCHWDDGATGVIEAARAAGRSDIFIIGVGGNIAGFEQVRDSTQALSVGQSYTSIVAQALDNARRILDGETVPTINIIPMVMVTIDNVNDLPWPEW